MRKLLLITALLCGGTQAQSVMYSGQDLYTRMTSNPVLANGYIAGVHNAGPNV